MNKIIHLSDLHLGIRKMNGNFQRLVDRLIETMRPANDYVIVITGDLIDTGYDLDRHRRCREFFDRLTAAGFKVLPVPGNHDYGRMGIGDKYLIDDFKRIYFDDDRISYPKVDFSHDGEIAFIGLDSMEAAFRPSGYMASPSGRLGEPQLGELERKLKDSRIQACDKRVVYLHHHPLNGLRDDHKLKDAEALCRLLLKQRPSVDALLFGHNHHGLEWNGWLKGISRCYDAGSSTFRRTKEENQPPHRVIDLSQDPTSDYNGKFLS